jgi:hypothetical protein
MKTINTIALMFQISEIYIQARILKLVSNSDEANDHATLALSLIEEVAIYEVENKLTWDNTVFFKHYPCLLNHYEMFYKEQFELFELNKLRNPHAKGNVEVVCQHGCNHSIVSRKAPWDFCANCGKVMIESFVNDGSGLMADPESDEIISVDDWLDQYDSTHFPNRKWYLKYHAPVFAQEYIAVKYGFNSWEDLNNYR